jgi:D-aminopeptidase
MNKIRVVACAIIFTSGLSMLFHAHSQSTTPPQRPRARTLGLAPGVFPPGALNAITDVEGVRVGHVTLIEGATVRTGVTAILPHGGNLFQEKVTAGVFTGNGFGKLAGSTQIEELGAIETPIVLTNTLSVGAAVEAVVAYTLALPGNEQALSVNAVVGETNDGALNDIRGLHVKREHVFEAIKKAAAGPVAEGSVGAGTGTICFGWKGGIGTASRQLPPQYGGWTLGVLVQTNFGGVLTMGGAPVGKELGRYSYMPQAPTSTRSPGASASEGDGSCLIVVATDAPLEARDLRRLAARAVYALARTGSSFSHGSGDYALAFTTAPEMRVRPLSAAGERTPQPRRVLPSAAVSPLFQAVLETTEEAVYNSLLQAVKVSDRQVQGSAVEALPLERLGAVLKKYGIGQ